MPSPSPVTPPDFKAVISDPTSTLCGNFISSLLKLPALIYKFMKWFMDDSGNPSAKLINGILPSGSLTMSACIQTEDGSRLLCDGREVDRTVYANLFAAISTTYGTPSGSSVFKIPDFRARFPVGIGTFTGGGSSALGVAGGEDLHVLTVGQLPAHHHELYLDAFFDTNINTGASRMPYSSPGTFVSGNTGGGQGHNTLPPYLPCFLYIIC